MNHSISRAWDDITQHPPALRKIEDENTPLRPQEHGNWLPGGGGVMHIGQIFAARGNHQCGSLPSDAQQASSCTAWQTSREENDHSATRQCRVLNCSPVRGQDSEERLITSTPPTLQSGISPLRLQYFRVPKYPDKMPVQCHLLGRPDNRLVLLTHYWKWLTP